MNEYVIITAALTGVAANRKQCPAIPYTPVEIADEAYRAWQAGAAVVHIHAREDDGSPSHRVEVYEKIMQECRKRCDVILNFSTGAVGVPKEERVKHIKDLKPEMGALNMGSMNYAKYSAAHKKIVFDHVFENPFETIIFYLEAMNAAGVKPELECFDVGHTESIYPLIDMGLIKQPIQFSFILGVLGGLSARIEHLAYQAKMIPDDSSWEVIGISRDQWKLVKGALELGGNVRVGLEDNFYLPNGEMAKSNGELVAEAVKLAKIQGRKVATVAEAKQILSL